MSESPDLNMIDTFERAPNPIFVISGTAATCKEAVQGMTHYLQTQDNYLYLPLNMEIEKRDTPGDTLCEIIKELLNLLIDGAGDADEKIQLSDLFRMVENLKKKTRQYEAADKLAEFTAFAESTCYPTLGYVFRRRLQTPVVLFNHFEAVADWGVKIRNFLLDRLLRRTRSKSLRFVLCLHTPDHPTLYYGSNQEEEERYITFYRLAGNDDDLPDDDAYQDNYRKDLLREVQGIAREG